MISREVEADALEEVRVSSQEISLFTPGPKAAIRHRDQADPPFSEELELSAYPNREACRPRDRRGRVQKMHLTGGLIGQANSHTALRLQKTGVK